MDVGARTWTNPQRKMYSYSYSYQRNSATLAVTTWDDERSAP